MIKVSIIMPCHNGEKYIEEAIESVIQQHFTDWELLVILDNSTDKSEDIVKSFVQKDSRIKLLYNKNSVGKPYEPRNVGILNSTGRYIAFLDCDDRWEPTKLKTQVAYFDGEKYAIVYSDYKKMDESGVCRSGVIKGPAIVTYKKLLNGNCIGNLTGIYDTILVGKILQKDIHHEDYVMWLEILRKGYKAINTQTVEAVYRESLKSISGNKFKVFKWTWNILRKELHLSLGESILHFIFYSINGIRKYFV